MARTLSFSIPEKNAHFAAAIVKVDRTKLYGDIRVEAFDENGNPCELLSIAGDGQTLFGKGGIAFATMNQDGEFADKSELIPIGEDGEVIELSESSFVGDIELSDTATVEEYLAHRVKSVYQLDADDAAVLKELLKDGEIYTFPFSYRKGIIVDTAFLLANDAGDPFMILTTPTAIEFLSFNDATPLDDEDEMDEDDGFDFGDL